MPVGVPTAPVLIPGQHLREQQKRPTCLAPCTYVEEPAEALAPGYGLSHTWLLQPSGERTSRQKISSFLSASLCSSVFKQTNKKKPTLKLLIFILFEKHTQVFHFTPPDIWLHPGLGQVEIRILNLIPSLPHGLPAPATFWGAY